MVLIPTIMKSQMGLNPAIIFLSLSLWVYVLGFIGLIIGLPLTTLIISYYCEFVLHQPNPLSKTTKKETSTRKTPLVLTSSFMSQYGNKDKKS
jgi:predicted PurR-regulated permease PerM